jgi:hypothetical protein
VLVSGATHRGAPGIFVVFEENADLVQENAESFGWDIVALQNVLYFLNAQITPDVVKAGAFDLTALHRRRRYRNRCRRRCPPRATSVKGQMNHPSGRSSNSLPGAYLFRSCGQGHC